jgi:alpha-tubulin suppressor-like RCC1 family protein
MKLKALIIAVVMPTFLVMPTFGQAVTKIAEGAYHSLFLKSDGSLWAMGDNLDGELGDGTYSTSPPYGTNRPEKIVASGVTAIAAGYYHCLFLKSDGSLWAMGKNDVGELGDGTYNDTNRPEKIVASGVTAIAAGGVSKPVPQIRRQPLGDG